MRAHVDVSDLVREATALADIADKFGPTLRKPLYATGVEAVHFIQRRFRTGGSVRPVGRDEKGRRFKARKSTTDTRTRIITGALLKAYGSTVSDAPGGGADLHVGLLAPGATGKVLHYGRTQEGYPANSNTPVEKFVIRPKNGQFLRFRIDGQWVAVREVTLRPRPSFPTVQEKLPPVLQSRVTDELIARMGGHRSGDRGLG